MPEGTVVFPYEPLIRVRAPIAQAQLIETAMLNIINHQTLDRHKGQPRLHMRRKAELSWNLACAARRGRMRAYMARGRPSSADAIRHPTCLTTADALASAGSGTHAHSWIMSFDSELEAFRAYAEVFPSIAACLLVDTYDTLASGMPNAITVFRELREKGYEPMGVRLDSGDLAYLSRMCRRMLDEAGFPNAKICASSDLDEQIIRDLTPTGRLHRYMGCGNKAYHKRKLPCIGRSI